MIHDTAAARYLLGNHLSAHVNPQLFILEQIAKPAPKVNPALSTHEEIRAVKNSGLAGDAREAAAAALTNEPTDYWNPLVDMGRNPETAIWARILIDEMCRTPTKEAKFSYSYAFWQETLLANLMNPLSDMMEDIAFGNELYRESLLNASANIGPNSLKGRGLTPDQNYPREFSEIISAGPYFLDNDGTALDEWSLLLSGIGADGYDPKFQEPGPRTVKGRTFAVDVNSDQHIRDAIAWISTVPETAEYQTYRMGWPLLGDNFERGGPLHQHMQSVWLASGGSRLAVWTAFFEHPQAWVTAQRAPVNTLHGVLKHYNVNAIPTPVMRRGIVRLAVTREILGYTFERATNAKGSYPYMSMDAASPFFRACRTSYWPGTAAQVEAAISIEGMFV